MENEPAWKSRIVGHDKVDPKTLKANPLNHRLHPLKQQKVVRASIEELGIIKSVIVNRATGLLVDGHERLEEALAEQQRGGKVLLDVEYVELSEAEEAKAIAILDASGEMATADPEKLSALLDGIMTESSELSGLFEDMARNADLSALDEALAQDSGTVSNPQTRAKLGDIWELGDNRVVCGDCTDPEVMAKVTDGQLADMLFTDPPYNVAYEGGTKDKLTIQNDSMDGANFLEFLLDVFRSLATAVRPGGLAYVCHADSEGMRFRQAFSEAGFELKQCLIWVKDRMVLGRQDYQWRHEPILYGWRSGAAHKFYAGRNKTTVIELPDAVTIGEGVISININGRIVAIKASNIEVVSDGTSEEESVWRFDKPIRNAEHPTMKPVELCARAISHGSQRGGAVLDGFLGSGSTLIAAEQLGRRCIGTELDPKYCDAILARWEKTTGGTARKVK